MEQDSECTGTRDSEVTWNRDSECTGTVKSQGTGTVKSQETGRVKSQESRTVKSQAKYTPRILSLLFHTNSKKVSVQFCLLPNHIASDFIRFISRPENVENSAKISSACCISCSSFKNNVRSSAYSAIFMILSKRPFLAFQ